MIKFFRKIDNFPLKKIQYKMNSITFRIIDLDLEEVPNTEMIVHISGLTQDNKSVYCQVLGYQPYCFLELPSTINWTGPKIEALKDYIKSKLAECPPDVMKFEIKKLCMYSVTRPILRINFKTESSYRHLNNLVRFPWKIEGFSKPFDVNAFKLHETNIPTLVKFIIERKLDSAGWVTVKPIKTAALPKDFSTCDYSIYTKPSFVSKSQEVSSDVLVDPLICAFDIEEHSKNRKSASPKPELPENVMTMISLCFGRISQPLEEWKTYVVTLYVGNQNPDGKYKAEIVDCKGSEKLLLTNFIRIVKKEQPDVFSSYNGNQFDWLCLLTRAELIDGVPTEELTCKLEKRERAKKVYGPMATRLFKMGKLKNAKGRLCDLSWESSARGKQVITYIKSTGIFNFDIYPEIRFNHTLPTYKLSYVAKHFLDDKENKEDMPYQQMFAIFDMVEVLERNLENLNNKTGTTILTPELAKKLIISKTSPEELLIVDGMTNHVADFYKALKKCKDLDSIVDTSRGFMLLLIKYVIQDARICPALMKFLNSLTSLWENATVCRTPANYIYEKGQQIKVLAQHAEQAYNKNYVIPFYKKSQDTVKLPDDDEDDDGKKNYQGATVLKVKKGLYKNIAVLDFAGLYPSIMMAKNICHSTLLTKDDPTPDSECNIAKWSEHIRCEHDPEKRKKKKNEKAYCGDHYYRFKKHHGKDENKGLLPLLLENMKKARSVAKKQMQIEEEKWTSFRAREADGIVLLDKEKDDMSLAYRKFTVLNARQLALKTQMNSTYGYMGATKGYFPLVEGAASVTYYGRESISKAISLVEEKFKGCEVIYGDSVTADTPVLISYNNCPVITSIKNLFKETDSQDYPGFKPNKAGLSEKQRCDLQYYCSWTDKGWSRIKRVIRHKCKKNIYRITSVCGQVDVTEDHSLIDETGKLIKPEDLVIGQTQLLYSLEPKLLKQFSMGLYGFCTPDIRIKLKVLCTKLLQLGENLENIVTNVECLGITDDFVYDLETECGRFHAGVGFNIVKNTDSIFINFHETDLKVIFEKGHAAEKYVTSNFPPEMKIEMEKVCGTLLLKTKKKYSYALVDEQGRVIKEESKGDINKRRDNCDAARDIYTLTETMIKKHVPQNDTLYEINNKILDIYRGLVPLSNFIIYKGLKQLVEEYKKCEGHVLFAKRLEERGNVMTAGTRLEYVFIKKRGKDLKSGERMEDWSFFLMNRAKDSLQIDYGYYVEHNVLKPTTEILNIAYPAPEKTFYKPEDNFKRAMDVYLKPKWREALKRLSLENKAKFIAKHSKRKALREAAKRFYAKAILDRLYTQHKLTKRRLHVPKRGASIIFLNDRVIQQICDFHRFWQEVIYQIGSKSGLPEWVGLRWEDV